MLQLKIKFYQFSSSVVLLKSHDLKFIIGRRLLSWRNCAFISFVSRVFSANGGVCSSLPPPWESNRAFSQGFVFIHSILFGRFVWTLWPKQQGFYRALRVDSCCGDGTMQARRPVFKHCSNCYAIRLNKRISSSTTIYPMNTMRKAWFNGEVKLCL